MCVSFSARIFTFSQMPQLWQDWASGGCGGRGRAQGRLHWRDAGGECDRSKQWGAWSCRCGDPPHRCRQAAGRSCVSGRSGRGSGGQDSCRAPLQSFINQRPVFKFANLRPNSSYLDTCTAQVSGSGCTAHNQLQILDKNNICRNDK